jgi:hypothetical protein
MEKKIAKYRLPEKEADLDSLVDSVWRYAGGQSRAAAQARTRQRSLPYSLPRAFAVRALLLGSIAATQPACRKALTVWDAFVRARSAWKQRYAVCKSDHVHSDTQRKNEAKEAVSVALSDLLGRGLLLPPRTAADADAVTMGFQLIDDKPTHPTTITDTVDIDRLSKRHKPIRVMCNKNPKLLGKWRAAAIPSSPGGWGQMPMAGGQTPVRIKRKECL